MTFDKLLPCHAFLEISCFEKGSNFDFLLCRSQKCIDLRRSTMVMVEMKTMTISGI